MALNLPILTQRALAAVFRLGPPVVCDGVFHRPCGFNPATGQFTGLETMAVCKFIGAHIVSAGYLGLAPVIPGTERLLIRASELAGISAPGQGDYVVENTNGLRRNIDAARLDPSGQFYTLQTVRSLDEDWGSLSAHTVSEDWGDLAGATDFEDRMALN